MALIAAMPDGNFLSHTSRVLEIALVLREFGHRVIFAGEGKYLELAREKDFEVVPAKTLDPEYTLACSRSGRANWWTYEHLKEGVAADQEVFERLGPDLVLGDFRLSLTTSTELAKIPYAVILNASWTDYYSASQRAPEHFPFTRIVGRPVATWLLPVLKRIILNQDAKPFQKLRRELGLDPRGNVWDQWRGDINLIADSPEYGPTENLPDNFHYIGPIIWEPSIPAPPWLEQLDPERPTIYITMGSTGDAHYFDQAIELFGDSDYQCMMTTAGLTQRDTYPSNFFVAELAPGSALMKRADVVVCQGGNGTIYQAMAAGVPIVGIPTMHDQEFNLDRVVALGFGIHLSELRFKPDHLRRAVDRVLVDPEFRTNAEQQAKSLTRWDGPRGGAEVLHRLLSTSATPEGSASRGNN